MNNDLLNSMKEGPQVLTLDSPNKKKSSPVLPHTLIGKSVNYASEWQRGMNDWMDKIKVENTHIWQILFLLQYLLWPFMHKL